MVGFYMALSQNHGTFLFQNKLGSIPVRANVQDRSHNLLTVLCEATDCMTPKINRQVFFFQGFWIENPTFTELLSICINTDTSET